MQTFNSSSEVISYLQRVYGSANFVDWQAIRRTFYSNVAYPEAGLTSATFFGSAVGTQNKQLTNMPKAGSFGQNHFWLKAIYCTFFINDQGLNNWDGTDAETLYSDIINGVFQTGVLELSIGSRKFVQVPKPFLYAPPATGPGEVYSAGIRALTLVEAAPNTLGSSSSSRPHANLANRASSGYLVDPAILIEAEQSFECSIGWPSGLVPVIATGITDDTTNPLYLQVQLDGIVFRPVQ